MKILVDENIPRVTVNWLMEQGHDVKDVRSTSQQGLEDSDLWNIAQTEKRLMITTDRGFLTYRNTSHNGILVVLISQPERMKIHRKIIQTFSQFVPEEWPGLSVRARDNLHSIRRWRSGKDEGVE